MGKKNPAQRTKGNAKASSSARAAELLSSSGTPAYSFGFGGSASASGTGNESPPATSIVPTAASVPFAAVATDDGDPASASNLDGDVKLLLKKMTKKDTITKCKALSEFVSLLDDDLDRDDGSAKNDGGEIAETGSSSSSSPVSQKRLNSDEIKALIPFWPRLYNALSMDSDRKVRELTQQAMLQLVKPERKKLLAPHLKTFLGAWMMALVDSYPPASSAASRAFDAAFTKPKQVEAVRFCRKEIFFYLKDILLEQSPTTLSDPKATPKDEMETKYERVVAASLSALKTLVEMTVEGDDAVAASVGDSSSAKASYSLDGELESLLSNKKMVKLSVHSNPMIRTSWFSIVATVCSACPQLFDKVCTEGSSKLAAPLASSVLNRFEETDPTVVGVFWNAVMAILKVVPDPWSHASLRKSVLPKLFLLLRSGCGGNAVVVGPHLVVLISKMPSDIVGVYGDDVNGKEGDSESSPALKFFRELSSAVKESLDKAAKIFQSASESAALILCLAECLQFLLISPGGSGDNDSGKAEDVDASSRIPLMREFTCLLETALRHKHSKQILSSRFFLVLDVVMNKVQKAKPSTNSNCQIIDLETDKENAIVSAENTLCHAFWSTFKNCVESWVDDDQMEMVEKLSVVLRDTKRNDSTEKGSKRNVGFDCDHVQKKNPASKVDASGGPALSPFKQQMLDELKITLYLLLEKSPSTSHLSSLRWTCDQVSNDRFLGRIIGQHHEAEVNTTNHFEWVYDNVWLPLRSKFGENDLNSQARMDFAYLLTSWVFNWEKAISPEFVDSVLKTVNDPLLLLTIAIRTQALPLNVLPNGWSMWLKSSTFSDYALEAVKVVIDGQYADRQKEDKDFFLTHALEYGYIDPLAIFKMSELLADALIEVWTILRKKMEGKWNVSTILKYASFIFAHNCRWNLDSISSYDGKTPTDLHLIIWRECIANLFHEKPSKDTELDDQLKTCNESALMTFVEFERESSVQELVAKHAAALGDVLRERIQVVGANAVSQSEDEIVSFISKACSSLNRAVDKAETEESQTERQSWRNVIIFLQKIFHWDDTNYYEAVSRQLWLPESIMNNSVYLDALYTRQIEARNSQDSSFTSAYLLKVSMLARIMDDLDLQLSDIPLTEDCERILLLIAEKAFTSQLIDPNPVKSKTVYMSATKDTNQLNAASPDPEGDSSLKSDISNVLAKYLKKEGDDVKIRYDRRCALNFMALLKSKNVALNLGEFYAFVSESKVFSANVTETCLDLALENSALELQRITFEQLRSSLKTSGVTSKDSADFQAISSLLFSHQYLSEGFAYCESIDRTLLLINELAQEKPATVVDNVAECADLSVLSWPVIQFNVNLMKILTIFIDHEARFFRANETKHQSRLTLLTSMSWDFIFCSILGWAQSVSESIGLPDSWKEGSQSSLKVLSFTKACCDLVAALSSAFCVCCCPTDQVVNTEEWGVILSAMCRDNVDDASSAWNAGKLKGPAKEWEESFCEPINAVLLSAFVKFADATVVSSSPSTLSLSSAVNSVAASFRSVLECCIPDNVLLSEDVEIEAKLLVDDFVSWKAASSHLQSLFNRLASHLVNPLVDIQLLVFHLILRLMPSVAKSAEDDYAKEYARREKEAENVSEDHSSSSDEGWRPPASLVNLLETSQTAFDILVDGMSVGELLHIEDDDDDDARSHVLAYILVWNAIRRLLNGASPELRAQYTIFLRDEISKVLRHLLFMLPNCLVIDIGRNAGVVGVNPARVAAVARLPLGAILETETKEDVSFILGNQDPILPPRTNATSSGNFYPPDTTVDADVDADVDASVKATVKAVHCGVTAPRNNTSSRNDIGANFYLSKRSPVSDVILADTRKSLPPLRSLHGLAGATFVGSFRDLPASVRQWWTDADKKTTAFVERVSSVHISPVLSARELNSVEDDQSKKSSSSSSALQDIIIKVRPQSREVVAIYTMDEITMELLIKVPSNFPLGQIAVECGKSLGEVKEQKRWMLQLTTFLRHQNGSIVDGIAMWKKNIDKPFEGVDPCMVCFSVLHSSNYQLPKLTCKACKKKFHSVCLYKWFSTSNNSSCPLCRSLF